MDSSDDEREINDSFYQHQKNCDLEWIKELS